jgi:hypothetical protein
MKYWKPITLALYGAILGYFLGKTLYALSAPLPWPHDTVIGYALGVFAGLFISFKLLAPWRTQRSTKAITALILLGFVAAIGIELAGLGLQMTRHSLILNELQSR